MTEKNKSAPLEIEAPDQEETQGIGGTTYKEEGLVEGEVDPQDLLETKTGKSSLESSAVYYPQQSGSQALSPMDMISMAVQQGADIEKLQALMQLKREWEQDEARKAYNWAMAQFKKNTPDIIKDKHVKYQNRNGEVTEYWHASLEQMTSKISEAMSPFGLSFTWDTKQSEGVITVTCLISHEGGYTKGVELFGSPDTSGGKNAIQAVGSTVKYLMRYTLEAATGISSQDPLDDDGQAAGAEPDEGEQVISEEQHNLLHSLVVDNGIKMATVEKWLQSQLGCSSLAEVKVKAYDTVLQQIKNTIAQRQKANQQRSQ